MFSPITKVGTLAEEDIAKWRVTIIAWPVKQNILAIDSFREKHAISIEG